MFIFLVIALAVATRASFIDPTTVDGFNIWKKFQAAFGTEKLNLAFSSPASLVSAILNEDSEASRVGCSVTYDFGTSIGKWSVYCKPT